jgi:hypothetical protein
MILRSALALALCGCVGDAIIARPLPGDAGPGADAATGDPVLRIEVTATGEDNASTRAAFVAGLEVFATRGGAPAEATLAVTRAGRPVTVQAIAPGHYQASLDDYAAASVLTVTTMDGVRHDLALTTPPIFTYLAPRFDEHVSATAPLVVAWSPSGDGASVTLLAPGGPRPVPDTGSLTLPAASFSTRGMQVIRVQRSTTITPPGLAPGSTLTVAIVNSVEVEVL